MVQLVGILNITPDSFSDGGEFNNPNKALDHAKQLFIDGAELVDVGAESTRPGAQKLTYEQEWARLKEVLPKLLELYPGLISLDTYHPENAERALEIGDCIINDVTGMNNPKMQKVIIKHNARCIISYLASNDTQSAHEGHLLDDIQVIIDGLLIKANLLENAGLDKGKIILDPGIGFGKTPELNTKLLDFAQFITDYPVMIGYSRKRFLGENRMNLKPNIEAAKRAIAGGAQYLRVHDVAGHKKLIDDI